MNMNNFTEHSLGFYRTPEDASEWFGKCARRIRDYLKKQEAPKNLHALIKEARGTLQFPIDEPPDAKIIGLSAHAAIEAMRRGKPKTAEALSARVLGGDVEWETGQPPDLNDLQWNWAKLANGMAWLRHPRSDLHQIGFRSIRNARRAASRALREKCESHPDRHYWGYVWIIARNYALVDLAKRFDSRIRKNTRCQNRLLRHGKALLKDATAATSYRYATALVAWNICQFGSIAGDDGLFIDGLDCLIKFYGKERILVMLEDDQDTGSMLKQDRVVKYLNRS